VVVILARGEHERGAEGEDEEAHLKLRNRDEQKKRLPE